MSDKPERHLAGRPSPLPAGTVAPPGATPTAGTPTTSGTASPTGTATTPATPRGTVAPTRPGGSPTGPGATTSPEPDWRLVAEIADASGDEEGAGPAYADLAGVRIEDGGRLARVTVFMHGTVPQRLGAEETMGVGVDFFRRLTQTESDYQLFVDGQPDGWYAYLHTPRGFVRYPGTFGLADTRLVFVLPWSDLGNPAEGRFSGFADWTRKGSVLNESAEDHAPAFGHTAFSR